MTAPARTGPSPSGGGPAVSPHPARTLPRRPKQPRAYITARERDVLRLAANGSTNRLIGRQLGVGEEAVKSAMQSILRKLRVNDRAQAVAVALRLGLLDLSDVVVPEGANQGWGNAA
ncbi:LuxR C-terminal-related transcriptional regulator [Streptomyces sp. DH8]|uniref:LuxR C-terminal-related transcriptional regulator n=1 Tax=Streptomyces sp. DH8 TaxID=2857008 RepID=UPI001E424D17|nr:LuxR C-terminal-related transcriptional regulator [Streptomyces sp. DH8]